MKEKKIIYLAIFGVLVMLVLGFVAKDVFGYYQAGITHGYHLETNADDFIGSADGTEANTSYVTGKFGDALNCNGSTSDVDFGSQIAIDTSDEYTITLWAKVDTFQGQNIFAFDTGSGGKKIQIQPYSGTTYFQHGSNYIEDTGYSSTDWVHLAITYGTDNVIRGYRNGQSIGTANGSDLSQGTVNMSFCNNGESGGYFDGKIDDLAVFDVALTQEEIEDIYNAGEELEAEPVASPTPSVSPSPSPNPSDGRIETYRDDFTDQSMPSYVVYELGTDLTGHATSTKIYGENVDLSGDIYLYSCATQWTSGAIYDCTGATAIGLTGSTSTYYYESNIEWDASSTRYYYLTFGHGYTATTTYLDGSTTDRYSGLGFKNYGEYTDLDFGLEDLGFIIEGVSSPNFPSTQNATYQPQLNDISLTKTTDNSFVLTTEFLSGNSGDFFIRARMSDSGLYTSQEGFSNLDGTGQTSSFYQGTNTTSTQTIYIENLAPDTYNLLQITLFKKNSAGEYIYYYQATSTINETTTGDPTSYSPPPSTGDFDIDIISFATSTTANISASATFNINSIRDYAYQVITEVRDASSTGSYFREVIPNPPSLEDENYNLIRNYCLENGTYRIWGTVKWTTLGFSRNSVTDQTNEFTINITNNPCKNPALITNDEIDDEEDFITTIVNWVTNNNPLNKFPFSWITGFFKDMKSGIDAYNSATSSILSTTVNFKLGNQATTTFTLFSSTMVTNIIGTDAFNILYRLLQFILWIGFGIYIYKRIGGIVRKGFNE